jgi:tetratricopeptide (TPR) repeat protein
VGIISNLRLIVAVAVIPCGPVVLAAQTPPAQAEDSSLSVPPDMTALLLDSSLRHELQDAVRERNYKRAETILVTEADRDPKSPRAGKLLEFAGGIFFIDGLYVNAVIAWKKADAIAPLDDRSRFTLAMAYIKLNRRDWARSELEKLEKIEPRNALYAYWLARLDYDAQQYQQAIAGLQKTIEIDPKMMRAYETLGLCYDYLGQFDHAIKNYKLAVELNRAQMKPSPWPYVDLAISLVEVNQLTEAEKNLREALLYDTRLPQAHYHLGRVLEKQGDLQPAIEELNQAGTLDPAYPEPHLVLGRIYHKLGKSQSAKSEIEKFQRLDKARGTPAPEQTSPQAIQR